MAVAAAGVVLLYLSYARTIETRVHDERAREVPRVYGRPLELWRGQRISRLDLIARFNDLGYAERPEPSAPGEFGVLRNTVTVVPRGGAFAERLVRLTMPEAAADRAIREILVGGGVVDRVVLDAPLITALPAGAARAKQRRVPLSAMPVHVRDAVLAVEDQSFYRHPGVNPLRLAAAAATNLAASGAPVGNSTITQQLARMIFQADAFNAELRTGTRSYVRYLQGLLMSVALERQATKDEILEWYLNDVYLGQRGSFAIHGVGEGARLFFGKDVANLTIGEAALLAGIIQSPASRSPFAHPDRARDRRDVVIRAMAAEGFITAFQAEHALREPLRVARRAVDQEAPYFVDLVGQQLAALLPGATARPGAIHVASTLDSNLQRAALDAVRRGLGRIDETLAGSGRQGTPQAALVAVDPGTGDVLALVGGRSYNESQFNRAAAARRQTGSVAKPFVFLAAFEHAAATGRSDLTPASLASDARRVLEVDGRPWEPKNADDEYADAITWRRALALSRNLATLDVGAQAGFDRVAALWRRAGVQEPPRAYPSIALGAFELTPFDVARAYTLFAGGGVVRPLRTIDELRVDGARLAVPAPPPVRVARPDTTFLVTNMMRSVVRDGTGAAARAAGFTRDAAGKTGTTDDLRDAWFAGFTPELLAVVWVGFDDNRPLGLTGSEAALPIWTDFMLTALSGRAPTTFEAPGGVVFAEIDPETGRLATPRCPARTTEAFLPGTAPTASCGRH